MLDRSATGAELARLRRLEQADQPTAPDEQLSLYARLRMLDLTRRCRQLTRFLSFAQ